MALVVAAMSCSFYVACGDDDVIFPSPVGGTSGLPDAGGNGGTGDGGTGGGGSGGTGGTAGTGGTGGTAGTGGTGVLEEDAGVGDAGFDDGGTTSD